MRTIFFAVIFSLLLSGCVSAGKFRELQKSKNECEFSRVKAAETLTKMSTEIERITKESQEKDAAIEQKDKKIEELRKKLEGLGVFN